MLSPNELIGKKVWLEVESYPDYPDAGLYRVKAVLTQPTSPPWFFARFEDPPVRLLVTGKWLTMHEAQHAVLYDPVIDEQESLGGRTSTTRDLAQCSQDKNA